MVMWTDENEHVHLLYIDCRKETPLLQRLGTVTSAASLVLCWGKNSIVVIVFITRRHFNCFLLCELISCSSLTSVWVRSYIVWNTH